MAGTRDGGTAAGDTGDQWPGQRLGLPGSGPGSMAPLGRRILALFIDWGIAMLIANWLVQDSLTAQLAALGIFAGMHIILVGLLGVTIGKRLMQIQVTRGTSIPGPIWSLVRTALGLLILPVILIGPDGRGAHDKAAGTVQLRM